ncbi:carbohydrate-binding module family 2-containing protein [Synechococcus sp. RS9909]|uniref:cellulose binding domain-containing protein n=1 Tax=unclassified Synechococcus TaxID=2626047 RepID=UPI0000690670|nr:MULTISPECIES: cellulose binding domain-containing protein [unclassified Synechococcus]EAQ70514.1 endo-1,4-beta-glucanase [Synechococcus sp. RS9917]QNI80614.1 carbohydrate-binding module family 2-containing protein [Synechococcus sp. RS9909]
MSSNLLNVSITGDIWWGGFTAALTITNTSGNQLERWSTSFESAHVIDGSPWGADLERESLADGRFRYTLTGADWGQSLAPGASVTVGFNGHQGVPLGDRGELTAALLTGADTPEASPVEAHASTEAPESAKPHDDTPHTMDHSHGSQNGYELITAFGASNGSMHTTHEELRDGRTPITTEALVAYNHLRTFMGLETVDLETVGRWAFAHQLTNNSQAWGDELKGVGLWYAMQGSKVGWIADQHYAPELIASLQRTARLGRADEVIALARNVDQDGFIEHLEANNGIDAFINTLKMEPHFGGWMHDRAHGWLPIPGGAIAHDINHLTILSHDQTQAFMNDTFDWPQWPALEVEAAVVIDYFQSMVSLGDPLGSDVDWLATREDATVPDATSTDPITGTTTPLAVAIDGDIWWGGFTAEITLTNTGSEALDDWSLSFISPHRIANEAWGATVSREALGDGEYRYVLTGDAWGSSIGSQQSLTVGFNGLQGMDLGVSGALSLDTLMVGDSLLTLT